MYYDIRTPFVYHCFTHGKFTKFKIWIQLVYCLFFYLLILPISSIVSQEVMPPLSRFSRIRVGYASSLFLIFKVACYTLFLVFKVVCSTRLYIKLFEFSKIQDENYSRFLLLRCRDYRFSLNKIVP